MQNVTYGSCLDTDTEVVTGTVADLASVTAPLGCDVEGVKSPLVWDTDSGTAPLGCDVEGVKSPLDWNTDSGTAP